MSDEFGGYGGDLHGMDPYPKFELKPILYFAGALFTRAEMDFNYSLAAYFMARNYRVNLPQQFCLDLKDTFQIFAACMRHLSDSDVVLVNCDGPDADSGTAFEAGWAYARSKTIISYRTDFRNGGDCEENTNLMIGKAAWKHLARPNASVTQLAESIEREINNLPQQLRVLFERTLT